MIGRVLVGSWVMLIAALAIASCSSEGDAPVQAQGGAGGQGEGGAGGTDSGWDGAAEDVVSEPEASAPVCPAGSWGTVPNTECDLIGQDCALGKTCAPLQQSGQPTTQCIASNNGFKTRGETCSKVADCAAGLKCIFGYCGPYCCKEDQAAICGPGGLCNVTVAVGNTGDNFVYVCSYLKPCTLWAGECPAGQACQVIGEDGSGACVPPAGEVFKNEGEPCESLNDCGDDQICLGALATAACRYLCMRSKPPWLAEMPVSPAPGEGGCPQEQKCAALADVPTWLGVCKP
ncbi:MAG TPA: hypothetical protein PLI95_18390 [Polyangiaceae bacterium]|nr:hypothetical protein [Polyangiaceae bacterium]